MEFVGAEEELMADEAADWRRNGGGEEETGARDGVCKALGDPSLYSMTSSGMEDASSRRRKFRLTFRMVNVLTVGEFSITLSKSMQGSEKGVSM